MTNKRTCIERARAATPTEMTPRTEIPTARTTNYLVDGRCFLRSTHGYVAWNSLKEVNENMNRTRKSKRDEVVWVARPRAKWRESDRVVAVMKTKKVLDQNAHGKGVY